jgi:hypothetical protein
MLEILLERAATTRDQPQSLRKFNSVFFIYVICMHLKIPDLERPKEFIFLVCISQKNNF